MRETKEESANKRSPEPRNDTQQRDYNFMKTTNRFINELSLMKQSKWIVPALIAMALVTALLGVTGCSPHPH
jgi:hypothetical protein